MEINKFGILRFKFLFSFLFLLLFILKILRVQCSHENVLYCQHLQTIKHFLFKVIFLSSGVNSYRGYALLIKKYRF